MVLASLLTKKFNRECIILEKAEKLQDHPKAHYLGFRTCEILSELDPSLRNALEAQLPDSDLWNSYVYTRGILVEPFARVRHFSKVDLERYKERFTTAFPAHLAQNKLTKVLLEQLETGREERVCRFATEYMGHDYEDQSRRVIVQAKQKKGAESTGLVIECDALIGADGVGSRLRRNIGIQLSGQKSK